MPCQSQWNTLQQSIVKVGEMPDKQFNQETYLIQPAGSTLTIGYQPAFLTSSCVTGA